MLKEKKHTAAGQPSINVTPLIDVLLVLLIIFMVISPVNQAKLPVKAPAPSREAAGPPDPSTLVLEVSGDQQLSLNSKPMNIDEFITTIADLMKERLPEQRILFIKAPKGIAYGNIVSLIDHAKGAGTITIGLVSDEA